MAPGALPVLDSSAAHVAAADSSTEISKDAASKRKRVNRSAKLKQCKLEARREQWLSHQGTGLKQGKEGSHADCDNSGSDLGEVIHPDFLTLSPTESLHLMDSRVSGAESPHSWVSVMNSSVSTGTPQSSKVSTETQQSSAGMQPNSRVLMTRTAEMDPQLSDMKSKSRSHLRVKRPDKEDSSRPSSDSYPSSNSNSCAFPDCGEVDTSPKSCGDKSPKSKVTKVGRGSSRGGRVSLGPRKSEKEECSDGECKNDGEKGPQTRLDERGGHGHDHPSHQARGGHGHDQGHDTEDGWETAADALGLHFVRDKLTDSLRTTAMVDDDDRYLIRSKTTLSKAEFSTKPMTQTGMLRSTSRRAWMQDDLCRPSSLPSLNKNQSLPARPGCNHQWSPPHKPWGDSPSTPPQCPICTEDLDSTDSSFDPCPCGFRLCLFCYHRIASDGGRCPGCRKTYSRHVSAKPSYILG